MKPEVSTRETRTPCGGMTRKQVTRVCLTGVNATMCTSRTPVQEKSVEGMRDLGKGTEKKEAKNLGEKRSEKWAENQYEK